MRREKVLDALWHPEPAARVCIVFLIQGVIELETSVQS